MQPAHRTMPVRRATPRLRSEARSRLAGAEGGKLQRPSYKLPSTCYAPAIQDPRSPRAILVYPMPLRQDYGARIRVRETVMKQQRNARLCAIVFGTAALTFGPPSAGAQTRPSPQPLDGLWLSDGYGGFFEFQGDSLRTYEITALSCIASDTATREKASGPANETVFAGDDDTFRIFPGTSADTRWFHDDGSVSNVMLRRTGSRP